MPVIFKMDFFFLGGGADWVAKPPPSFFLPLVEAKKKNLIVNIMEEIKANTLDGGNSS